MGIPRLPPARPKSPPARPSPPVRPPLPTTPTTTPKHTPKAGVISIVKTDQGMRPVIGDTISAIVPHRPAPPVAPSKIYQEPEQPANLSRKSSSSSTSSSIHESPQRISPPVQSLCIQDQDTGAIYEEIDDEPVSISV